MGAIRPVAAVGFAESQVVTVVAEDRPASPLDFQGLSQTQQPGRIQHEGQPRLGRQPGQSLLKVVVQGFYRHSCALCAIGDVGVVFESLKY